MKIRRNKRILEKIKICFDESDWNTDQNENTRKKMAALNFLYCCKDILKEKVRIIAENIQGFCREKLEILSSIAKLQEVVGTMQVDLATPTTSKQPFYITKNTTDFYKNYI